ncbi:MFS transporter [Novosphingobium sp. G106]|nr:MFS transporter [Novosphingobium sp. G106]
MALGLALNHYVMSLFAPAMIAEFGWSRAKYALVGATPFLTMFLIPLAGRFTDRVGPRKAAAVGFIALPLGYLALSFMNGSFAVFLAIIVVKSLLGTLTTTMVFARVIVERFDRARGIALSIVMSGAPLVAALAIPFLAQIIDVYGWRNGFRAIAVVTVLGGCFTMAMMGGGEPASAAPGDGQSPRLSKSEIGKLFASPLFLLAIGGMLLVNIPQLLVASQLKLVLAENGATGQSATWIVSLYAIGVVIGRFICGAALDRVPVHKVAIMALGAPAIGLAALASPFDSIWLLSGSILLMALAQGAEGDIGAYLISRKFELRNYSLIMSFMTVSLTLGSAFGSVMLSYSLSLADSYAAFLSLSAGVTLVGAYLFFLTGRFPPRNVSDPMMRGALAT